MDKFHATIRLRCVRVCGPEAAAHLCPAVQRSQAFCFEVKDWFGESHRHRLPVAWPFFHFHAVL